MYVCMFSTSTLVMICSSCMPYFAQSVAGMSDCYKDTLLCFKSTLKENVDLKTGLEDILPIAAGGFMSRTEAHYVAQLPGNLDQMGAVVDCLCRKRNEDFFTFLKMLKDTSNGHWADALLAKAEEFKRETVKGTQYAIHINIGMQTARILRICINIEDLEGAHVPGVMSACSTVVPSLSTVQ